MQESDIIINFAVVNKCSMNVRILIAIIFCTVTTLHSKAGSQIERLDDAISKRDYFISAKRLRIDSLRNLISVDCEPEEELRIYNKLFKEYLTFNFDSTMLYVERAEKISSSIEDDNDMPALTKIHRALALATSGHFSHAADILRKIDSEQLSTPVKEEYYIACECTYGSWAEYSEKHTIGPEFQKKSLAYLDSLISVTRVNSPEYFYRIGERALRKRNFTDARKYNLMALDSLPVNCRMYAQSAFSLALAYKGSGDKEKYKEWLINAAISDQTVPLKENLALQELAMVLKTEDHDLSKANRYLRIALEDAVFYNNRLRMLEIAEKIPDIVNVYQDTIEQKNNRLKLYLLIIGALVIILCVTLAYIFSQHKKVSRSKDDLAELNEKLRLLNQQLSQTNKTREQYVSLFMDLCAAYIEKLNRFPSVLKMKVRQLSDLSSVADRYVRPSDAEIKEMFFNFDSAFLRLYPDFIDQFNSLLRTDECIVPKKGELLNTDLRIYALVRMGIEDSNKIASLMFLSSQTIFNHRTRVRNKAKDRENFEKSVMSICPTITSESIPNGQLI